MHPQLKRRAITFKRYRSNFVREKRALISSLGTFSPKKKRFLNQRRNGAPQ